MRAYRIKISAWTSSFRYPNILSGFQPTLPVPPISTALGIINACAGTYLSHDIVSLGYYFEYGSKSVDLETIYQVELDSKDVPRNQMKSNVIRREFLYDTRLYIYLFDSQLASYFRSPVYPLLLGRSSDLATIDAIEEVELVENKEASKIKGQLVPFKDFHLPGLIQALPKYFTDEIPRNTIGTEAYSVIPFDALDFPTSVTAFRDTLEGKELDIFIHNLKFSGNE